MCWIGVFPPFVMPDIDVLDEARKLHQDGSGAAIAGPHGMVTARSLRGPVAAAFIADRTRYPDAWAAIHFRSATVGAVSGENLHPVAPLAAPDVAVLHNGTMPEWMHRPGEMDTRTFANILAEIIRPRPDIGERATKPPVKVLERMIGPRNRVAILTGNPDYGQECYLLNQDQWLEQEGIGGTWYASNADHLPKGIGWDEGVGEDGRLYRWGILQPGQCVNCCLFHDSLHCPNESYGRPYRYRCVPDRSLDPEDYGPPADDTVGRHIDDMILAKIRRPGHG